MRIAIVKTSGYLDQRIFRVLKQNNFKGEIIRQINNHTLDNFEAIIFTEDKSIPNIPKIMEQLVIRKKAFVIYVQKTLSQSYFYNILEDPFFILTNEQTIEVELVSLLKQSKKYMKYILQISNELSDSKAELDLVKKTQKAKVILMQKGFTEAESHRFIQIKAMELRVSKKHLVNLIIKNQIDI